MILKFEVQLDVETKDDATHASSESLANELRACVYQKLSETSFPTISNKVRQISVFRR